MCAVNLHQILVENEAAILSTAPSDKGDSVQLCALQKTVFSYLLSLLEGHAQTPESEMKEAAKNATGHTIAQQIAALDELEAAIFKLPQFASGNGPHSQELARAVSCFCSARQIIANVYQFAGVDLAQVQSLRPFKEVMSQILNPGIGTEKVLDLICSAALKVATADAVAIYTMDRVTGDFTLKQLATGPVLTEIAKTRLSEFMEKFKHIPKRPENNKGLFAEALENKRPLFCGSIANDSRVIRRKALGDFGITAVLVLPMLESGKGVGFMSVVPQAGRTFTTTEVESLALFAEQAAVAWRNAELYNDLRKSEKKYRDLIDNAIDIIFILDMEGKFVSANKRGEQLTQLNVEDWIGRHFSELVNPEDLPVAMEGWSRGIRGGTEPMLVKVKNAKGEDIYLQVNGSLIEENGVTKGVMCIARDATMETKREAEFKKLHESVVDTNRKLEESVANLKSAQAKLVQTEKLSAMGDLISGVAHELNNPLTGIMGYSQLLLESIEESEHREDLEKINHEALRCRQIVQNLLRFARSHKPEKRLTDINAAVRSIVDLREYRVRLDGIRLDTHLDQSQPHIIGDFYQLQQVILNILSNAHQAIMATKLGEKIEIRTESDEVKGIVRILITDDGPGIPPENLPRIFDPFFTTKEIGEGTGLGLSVAYGIVQEHGGQITVESALCKGAAFQIELPLAEAQPEIVQVERPEESAISASRGAVLVVDDEEVILDLLTDILTEMNHDVERAHNGTEALERIAVTDFDFIICDLKMPGMDGKALYHRIQTTHPELSNKIIFSTGDTLSEDFQVFCTTTKCKVVEKPFLLEDLKKAIDALKRT